MNLIDYLKAYKDITFDKVPFNEVDALALSLMSYFPFDLIGKKKIKGKDVVEFLKDYQPEVQSERKLLDLVLFHTICTSTRFKGIKFINFAKKKDGESIEQFQAITIDFKKFMFLSFCGTDATVIGWREDFNMSFLEIVPSEVDAIKYANIVRQKHPYKPIYIGGHSKGGRLAIRAGKDIYKNNTVKAIFSFDGPNFTDSFYDYQYEQMKTLIYEYTPNEAIVGRLIRDQKKIIVKSSASGIAQHNGYTWLVEDDHFVHADGYTEKSNKIAKISKSVFETLSYEEKSVVVNTLFDVADRVHFTKLKASDSPAEVIKDVINNIKIGWKDVPKEKRKKVIGIIFTIISIALTTRK